MFKRFLLKLICYRTEEEIRNLVHKAEKEYKGRKQGVFKKNFVLRAIDDIAPFDKDLQLLSKAFKNNPKEYRRVITEFIEDEVKGMNNGR